MRFSDLVCLGFRKVVQSIVIKSNPKWFQEFKYEIHWKNLILYSLYNKHYIIYLGYESPDLTNIQKYKNPKKPSTLRHQHIF